MGRSYSDRQSPLSKRIKTGINPHRLLYFSNVWKRTGKMGSWWRTGFEVRNSLIQIDSIPAQHFAKFTTVDDCQRVEVLNARADPCGFEIGESTSGDQVLFIVVFASKPPTCGFNLAHR